MKLVVFLVGFLVMGAGCYPPENVPQPETKQETKDCVAEGQKPEQGQQCCPGLELVPLDHAYSACGKPGTGYVPQSCANEGENIFVDTPECCSGLQPVLNNDKYVCTK